MQIILSQPLWDEEKIVQNGQTEQKSLRTGFFGYPKAYKGTPRGEVCS